jgi:hypothetical protein
LVRPENVGNPVSRRKGSGLNMAASLSGHPADRQENVLGEFWHVVRLDP